MVDDTLSLVMDIYAAYMLHFGLQLQLIVLRDHMSEGFCTKSLHY